MSAPRIHMVLGLMLLVCIGMSAGRATPLNVRVNSDATTEIQNEQQIWISPLDANVVLADWRDFRLGYRRVGIGVSTDGGFTWQDSLFTNTPYLRHSDPCLIGDQHGNFYACVLNYIADDDTSFIAVYRSTDNGSSWSGPVMTCDYIPPNFEDKQMTAIDRTGGSYDGNYYVSWGRFPDPTRIMFVRSVDGTGSFEDTMVIGEPITNEDLTYGSGNFSMPVVDADGDVHVLWLGVRVQPGEPYAYYAIRQTSSTDGGQTFGDERVILDETIGYATCEGDIDIYGAPIVDCDISNGPYHNTLYYAQTQYSGFYLNEPSGFDVFVWKSTDKGITWLGPSVVNDDPVGQDVDQFHPWLVVNEDGVVLLVFYDQRNDPVNHYLFDAYFSASFDGGETYVHNMRISEVSSNPDFLKKTAPLEVPEDWRIATPVLIPTAAESRAGKIAEYIGIHAINDTVSTIWTDTRNGNQDCYSARFIIPFQPPRLYLPEDSSGSHGTNPSFRWSTCWHETMDSYRLEISSDESFSAVDYVYDDIADNNFTVTSPLDPDSTYFWRVKAFRTAGDSTDFSEAFLFGVQPETLFVVSVDPNQNTNAADPTQSISAMFDSDLDGSIFNYGTFLVTSSSSARKTGTYSYDDPSRVITFDPLSDFAAGEKVTSVLTAGIESLDSKVLVHGFAWSYLTAVSSASPGMFEKVLEFSAGDGPSDVYAADFDGDGYIDLALTNYLSDNVSVLENDGDGTFSPQAAIPVGTEPVSICAADVDVDGYFDLVCANSNVSGSSVSVLINTSPGTFAPAVNYPVSNSPVSVCAADFNCDGYPDLATADDASFTVSVLMNDGDGTFGTESTYSADVSPHTVCTADLDNDGDIDIVCGNLGAGNVTVLLNTGDGSFGSGVEYAAGDSPTGVIADDFDADGDMDLAVSNSTTNGMSVLINDGDGTFAAPVSYPIPFAESPSTICGGDFDGDGDIDIVTQNMSSLNFTVLLNDGDGTFTYDFDYPYGLQSLGICTADLDGDLDLDIAAANFTVDRATVLYNSVYYVCGDADQSYAVDIDDVVYLIAYIFSGGPAPDPIESGDADCSGSIDIDDVVYLISYIFSGGPAPCDPDGDLQRDC